MIPGVAMAALQFGQGIFNFNSKLDQSRQIRENARVMEQDMITRRNDLIARRRANAIRETKISSQNTAQLVNQYAVSGVEFSGDVANYVAKASAVDELNKQQATQDALYSAAVMDVERRNMKANAKYLERSMRMSAVSSLIGGGLQGMDTFTNTTNYWEKYGPQKQNPLTTAGSLGGAGVSFLGTQEGKISIIER